MTCDEVVAKYPIHFSGPRRLEVGDGWADLVDEFMQELDKLPGGKDLVFFCIKEKFGVIRFQPESYPKVIYEHLSALEQRYEARSRVTCEECGKRGRHKARHGWMNVLCDEHEAARNKERGTSA